MSSESTAAPSSSSVRRNPHMRALLVQARQIHEALVSAAECATGEDLAELVQRMNEFRRLVNALEAQVHGGGRHG